MLVFAVIIAISIVMYIYYKVAILKTKEPLNQVYFNSKARLCLGSIVFFFSINQYLLYQTKLSLYIGLVLFVLGGANLIRGFREAKHYKKEARRLGIEQ